MSLLFTCFSVSDPNKAKFESFQSYFFGLTNPVQIRTTSFFNFGSDWSCTDGLYKWC